MGEQQLWWMARVVRLRRLLRAESGSGRVLVTDGLLLFDALRRWGCGMPVRCRWPAQVLDESAAVERP